jgi:hypothetical protein
MDNEKISTTTVTNEQPDIVKRIGQTTYMVNVYFSETSKETLVDKMMRLMLNEVKQM